MRHCLNCNSVRIAHFRYDYDWGDGGDFMPVNDISVYEAEQATMFKRNERPDISCYVCLDCQACFDNPISDQQP